MVKKADIQEKPLPYSLEIEKSVLGALIKSPELYSTIYQFLDIECFYYKEHQQLYDCYTDLVKRNKEFTVPMLLDSLKNKNYFDEHNNMLSYAYIFSLTESFVNSSALKQECIILLDFKLKRELIFLNRKFHELCYNSNEYGLETLHSLCENVYKLNEKYTFNDSRLSNIVKTVKQQIEENRRNDTDNYIKTGNTTFDSITALREGRVFLIAGSEGNGKTKFLIHLVNGIIKNNEKVALLGYFMEESRYETLINFISPKVSLSGKEMQSIQYDLSDEEMSKINTELDAFNKIDSIEIIDKSSSIEDIAIKSKSFFRNYNTYRKVLVIDNIGCVNNDSEEYIAKQIEKLSKEENILIIEVHHLTKEVAQRFNIKDAYRPRKEYIRGSTRTLDYVQQAILVNFPSRYTDLYEEERMRFSDTIDKKSNEFTVESFTKEFWSINSSGDSYTKSISNLFDATYVALNNSLEYGRSKTGGKLTYGFLLSKYSDYHNIYMLETKDVASQYKKEKISIYQFIKKKMWLQSFKRNGLRDNYLYGKRTPSMRLFEQLFIVEYAKNRYSGNKEDEKIIRFGTRLKYGQFQELPPIQKELDKPTVPVKENSLFVDLQAMANDEANKQSDILTPSIEPIDFEQREPDF